MYLIPALGAFLGTLLALPGETAADNAEAADDLVQKQCIRVFNAFTVPPTLSQTLSGVPTVSQTLLAPPSGVHLGCGDRRHVGQHHAESGAVADLGKTRRASQ